MFGKGGDAFKNSKWLWVTPENEELILNRSCVPMGGMMSPASNPNQIKSLSKLLKTNSFKAKVPRWGADNITSGDRIEDDSEFFQYDDANSTKKSEKSYLNFF